MVRILTTAMFSLTAHDDVHDAVPSRSVGCFRAGVAALACTALVAGLAACAPAPVAPRSPSASASTTQPQETAMTPPSSLSPSNSGSPSKGGTPSGSPESSATRSDLSITVTPSPGAQPQEFRLVASNGTPGPESTVPDPSAALAALERYGQGVFFPVPGPPQQCMEIFSGPQVAVVTGVFNGRAVTAIFKRTDSCQTALWQALAPLFGTAAGGTGAI